MKLEDKQRIFLIIVTLLSIVLVIFSLHSFFSGAESALSNYVKENWIR